MEKEIFIVLHLITGDRFVYKSTELRWGKAWSAATNTLLLDPTALYRILSRPQNGGEMQVFLTRMDADFLAPIGDFKLTLNNILFTYVLDPKNPIQGQLPEVDKQVAAKKAGIILP